VSAPTNGKVPEHRGDGSLLAAACRPHQGHYSNITRIDRHGLRVAHQLLLDDAGCLNNVRTT